MATLIKNATIFNEGRRFIGSVRLEGAHIAAVVEKDSPELEKGAEVIDATGLWLLPGMIDTHVHFREPGLTHKGDIGSESRAAIAGGITSFIDMPNTQPQTTTLDALARKLERAEETAMANYAFFFGATDDNVHLLHKLHPALVPGIKLFLGASTGNMRVEKQLERIFGEAGLLLAVHAESDLVIRQNIARYTQQSSSLDASFHPRIRSAEACYAASAVAIALAQRHNARLHLLHLSTAIETALLSDAPLTSDKRITAEVCVHHLWFTEADYPRLGNRIKWNPAIKTEADRQALRQALLSGKADTIGTDHSPHLPAEKEGDCLTAASGAPMVQHALPALLEMTGQALSVETVVEKTAHAPATLFGIDRRGFIRPGYYADIVLVAPNAPWTVTHQNIRYKCGWSPFEGQTFRHAVRQTFLNGRLAYNDGVINDTLHGMQLVVNN